MSLFTQNRQMTHTSVMENLTAILYRMATYATHNLMDDAAMLAFIFS